MIDVKGPARMQFNNLRRNILAMLGECWRQTGAKEKFSLRRVRTEFSDIPAEDLEGYIESLARNGYIKMSEDSQQAELTPKGVDQLKLIDVGQGNKEMVFVKELE